MIQKKKLDQKIKKMFATKGNDPTKIEITPYRDWRIVVIIFLWGIFVSLGLNVYLFMRINEEDFFGASVKKEEIITFNTEKLLTVLEGFKKKEEISEALKKAPTPIIDPSL